VVSLEPAFTAAAAFVLFGERLDSAQLAGGAMILAAVGFLRIYEGWAETSAATVPSGAPETLPPA
jgi:drug/metabolite transporter (DMT)-like permease